MKTLFIINPTSGNGQSVAQLSDRIQQRYGAGGNGFEIRSWEEKEGLGKLLEDAQVNFEAVVAVGGDGTVNAIAQHLLETDLVLGILPTGSGNGLARHLGFTGQLDADLARLKRGVVTEMDVGEFGGHLFLNNAGIGVDALIANRFDRQNGGGMATYFRISVQTLLSYPGVNCELEVDGEKRYDLKNMLIVDIANGPEWGGGARIAPVSHIRDGLLEAVLLEKTSIPDLMQLGWKLFRGSIHRHPKYRVIRGREFRLRRLAQGPAQVDGEAIPPVAEVSANIRPKALRILVPNQFSA